jgi:hypothetical protein
MPRPITECECPFYRKTDNFRIYCESEIKGATTILTFGKYRDRKEHFEKYCCCNGGKNCLHYRYVASLYERGVLE